MPREIGERGLQSSSLLIPILFVFYILYASRIFGRSPALRLSLQRNAYKGFVQLASENRISIKDYTAHLPPTPG